MGCDIHLCVERRTDGQWVSVDTWETEDGYTHVAYDHCFYRGRNYELFAMLAGVRNYYQITPITAPKGLPDDASPEVAAWAEQWGDDGHSHSWLTLAELQAYNWGGTAKHEGYVDAVNYMLWKEHGAPRAWCGRVGGQMVQHLTHHDMEEQIEMGERWTEHAYTLVHWEASYSEGASKFVTETMPKLAELGAPEDVRIVFWFDN